MQLKLHIIPDEEFFTMVEKLLDVGKSEGTILDAIPSPIFIVDNDVRIIWVNRAAAMMLPEEPKMVIRRRAGDILHCVHSTEVPQGCGRAEFCQDCLVRNSVSKSVIGHKVVRRKAKMELVRGLDVVPIHLLVTTAPFVCQHNPLVLLILEDISELMELKDIVPICSYCKKVRDDDKYWQSVEGYLKAHLDLDFSHGICPDCAKEFFPSKGF